ncbi:glycoside hydrolase family 16 protein [Mycena rosella]|uniref:Glycoside hydrolase family 16 protein n=1 Tax=Mycena rosella TaxID=1033263 RepID=A0AAD7DUK6_MYCRO|nr:glycoside hydrolase family 16 protein [Mycena rosella]
MRSALAISVRLLAFSSTLYPVLGATYSRSQNIVGTGFYNAFNFEAISDPTHGRVNYVDQATAQSTNLTFASANTFILRADATTVISDSSSVGRNSVRIKSNNAYTTHVAVFDIVHMPQGCGTWPAVWETNEATWPSGGEVDILEGVNDQATDQVTLHTAPGCSMPASRTQTGTSLQLDCDTSVNGNSGCGVNVGQAPSFGPTFNADGGGWYAVERTSTFISVWFWSRNAADVPADVKAGSASVNTDSWGTPVANFPNTSCNIPQFFDAHNIIINLTFCGDWAGIQSIYASGGCPSTCNSYVHSNPAAFADAYFQFNAINVYT